VAETRRRAIAAELPSVIARLKGCASPGGVISQRDFAVEADRLGLASDEQRRGLRNGLAAVGLQVRASRVGRMVTGSGSRCDEPRPAAAPAGPATPLRTSSRPVQLTLPYPHNEPPAMRPGRSVPGAHHEGPGDPRSTAPVKGLATGSGSAVPGQGILTSRPGRAGAQASGQLVHALRMLKQYADRNGTVSRLAHDGVRRLHGLSPGEAQELARALPIRRARPADASSETAAEAPAPSADAGPAVLTGRAFSEPGPGDHAPAAALSDAPAPSDRELAEAVRAARAVLAADRRRRAAGLVLLTAEQEVGLAVMLRDGAGPLGRDIPSGEVAGLPRDGERWRAYECLVVHNERLVWKIAQHYLGRGLDIEDLVQHGTLGLMRAVRKFDAGQGNKFSTYATWWVKQAVTRAIADEGTLIRVPVHFHEKVAKVAAVERKLQAEGRARTVEDIAFVSGLTFAEVERARKLSRPTDSLDRIIGDDTAIGDLIIGPSLLPGPATVVLGKEFQARLRHVLSHLPERERHIIVRRTGLDGAGRQTLEDLGTVFGVTRERIRQVEGKAKGHFREELVRHGLLASPR
jgi:RNA polymerase primary sigma factor